MTQEHGSLQNLMMGNTKSIDSTGVDIVVGMGATEICWSDRHAYTVIEISRTGKTITIQRDDAKRTDNNGQSESQEYEFTPNPKGATYQCRKNIKGVWKIIGGNKVIIGRRAEYYDPCM